MSSSEVLTSLPSKAILNILAFRRSAICKYSLVVSGEKDCKPISRLIPKLFADLERSLRVSLAIVWMGILSAICKTSKSNWDVISSNSKQLKGLSGTRSLWPIDQR